MFVCMSIETPELILTGFSQTGREEDFARCLKLHFISKMLFHNSNKEISAAALNRNSLFFMASYEKKNFICISF